jgi:hypothetical protein
MPRHKMRNIRLPHIFGPGCFDFEDYASPLVAAELIAQFGQLNNLRVDLNFLNQIEHSFD